MTEESFQSSPFFPVFKYSSIGGIKEKRGSQGVFKNSRTVRLNVFFRYLFNNLVPRIFLAFLPQPSWWLKPLEKTNFGIYSTTKVLDKLL